ncbi:hypothetical protein ACH5RR_011046 [Cinchona calisaya]|uniref:Uncharacterized protein n=1 Tax=Cinchona calisaya TaxID=153742 RepID=A0ABD3A776_9GENT
MGHLLCGTRGALRLEAIDSAYCKICIPSLVESIATIHGAHVSPCGRHLRRGKAGSASITSVLCLRDEVSIVIAGAVDRNLERPVIQACPYPDTSTEKERRFHGISSLPQGLNGVFISASCMDSGLKMAQKTFSGCRINSFFVKVNKPQLEPLLLKSHDGEVTTVDWCPSEMGKGSVLEHSGSCYSNSRSPSSIQRRVMALPGIKQKKLFIHEWTSLKNNSEICPSDIATHMYSPKSTISCEISTPESQRSRYVSKFGVEVNLNKTPEAARESPSSVLHPPSSVKRGAIRDYFLVA